MFSIEQSVPYHFYYPSIYTVQIRLDSLSIHIFIFILFFAFFCISYCLLDKQYRALVYDWKISVNGMVGIDKLHVLLCVHDIRSHDLNKGWYGSCLPKCCMYIINVLSLYDCIVFIHATLLKWHTEYNLPITLYRCNLKRAIFNSYTIIFCHIGIQK